MVINSGQMATRLYGMAERVPDIMPGRMREETGCGSERSLKQLMEQLRKLTDANQAMENELLEYRNREAGLGKDLLDQGLPAELPPVLMAPGDISGGDLEEIMFVPPRRGENEFQTQAGRFQAERIDAVARLAGGIAHELNNQLTVVYACVDLLLSGLSSDNPLYRSVSRIRNSALACADLTGQLLLFSCRFPLFKVATDLNQRLGELKKMLPRLPGGSIDIRLETGPHLWMVNADPAVIDQAIANLVLNAWDAMPDGGILTVRTENLVAVCPGQADIAAGRFVCLSVSDTGVGIEESARPHLFEPFYTTRRPARGMGLGLPVVYGVVRAHDGWVEVDSTPGRGSTFRINLPAVEEAL